MPAAPPPVLAPRRKTRQIQVGKVGVGSDSPISVQSMTTTLTSDVNATLQQIAELTATGCDIVRVACPRQDDADALPGDRAALADPGDRRHPLPAEVRLRRDRGRLRRGPGQPGQHPQVRRPGQGDRGRRQGPRHLDPDRRQRRLARQAAAGEVRQGHARGAGRVGGLGGLALRGARLPRLQDLGQAQRPGRDGPRLRAARRGRRLAAAPRRHRGRARRSRAPSSRRPPSARCSRRASATPSASRCPRRRSRRSRSASRSWSRSTSSRAGSRSSPARRAGGPRSTSTSSPRRSPPASTGSRCRCGSR